MVNAFGEEPITPGTYIVRNNKIVGGEFDGRIVCFYPDRPLNGKVKIDYKEPTCPASTNTQENH